MKTLKLACAIACAAIITGPTAALAASYNAVDDFNTTNNIDDTWTYGTKSVPDGPLTLLSNFTTNSVLFGNGNTQNWYYHTGSAATGGACPAEGCEGFGPFIAKNTSPGTLGASGVTFPNSVLMITPGDPLSAIPGPALTVVRWTSPESSTYDMSGSFINLQQATTSLYVVVNGVVTQLPGLSAGLQTNTISFSNMLIGAGGTVDFVVSSRGAGEPLGPGIQYFDPVGLSVTIQSAVPEPQTWLMLLGGLLALGQLQRRTRRAA